MRRRSFLMGSILSALALLVPAPWRKPQVPILYGDGVHDDTATLVAWGEGREARWPDGSPVCNVIDGKRFYLPDGFTGFPMVRLGRPTQFTNCLFTDKCYERFARRL